MTIAVLATLGLASLLILYGATKIATWLRTPTDLRGDWWGRFERQFQAYAGVSPAKPGRDRSRN